MKDDFDAKMKQVLSKPDVDPDLLQQFVNAMEAGDMEKAAELLELMLQDNGATIG